MTRQRIRLVTRADDAGSCRGANEAIERTVREGIVRNVSVMAVGGAFDAAAEMLRGLGDVCIGLHATINAEWDDLKWGPVAPVEKVPSLADSDGHFLATPAANRERGSDAGEMLLEIEAQLARARGAGLAVAYLDLHMGFSWLPGVADRLAELCRREGLLRGDGTVPPLPKAPGEFGALADELIARLAAAEPGDWLIVSHPGLDTPEMRRLWHAGLSPGQVARQRAAETRMLTSPEVRDYCRANGVTPARFTDVLTH